MAAALCRTKLLKMGSFISFTPRHGVRDRLKDQRRGDIERKSVEHERSQRLVKIHNNSYSLRVGITVQGLDRTLIL
jgi:hypothetical protein